MSDLWSHVVLLLFWGSSLHLEPVTIKKKKKKKKCSAKNTRWHVGHGSICVCVPVQACCFVLVLGHPEHLVLNPSHVPVKASGI